MNIDDAYYRIYIYIYTYCTSSLCKWASTYIIYYNIYFNAGSFIDNHKKTFRNNYIQRVLTFTHTFINIYSICLNTLLLERFKTK